MSKQYGLKVNLNGQVVSRAGLGRDNYVVVGSTTFVRRNDGNNSYHFNVHGLDSQEEEHVFWYGSDIKIGDTITLEIIDKNFDPPKTRYKSEKSPEEQLKQKLKQYYHLKKELKEYLKEF